MCCTFARTQAWTQGDCAGAPAVRSAQMGPEDSPATMPVDAGDERISLEGRRPSPKRVGPEFLLETSNSTLVHGSLAALPDTVASVLGFRRSPSSSSVPQPLLSVEMLPRTTRALNRKVGKRALCSQPLTSRPAPVVNMQRQTAATKARSGGSGCVHSRLARHE
jgi:hypothetical protein